MEVGKQFFKALYGHPAGTSMAQARYNMYSRKQDIPLYILYLLPTDINLYLHVRATCTSSDVAVEGSRSAGPTRCGHPRG